jgi:putative lipoprotein
MNKYIACLLLLVFPLTGMAGEEGPVTGAIGNASLVTGSVSYRERIALPADAVIHVALLDVSLMDVAAKLISEQTITPQHQVPIPFALEYDPNDVDERMTYAVRATIRSAGKLVFTTDRSYQVLTRGQPDHVELILVRVR